VLINGKDVAAPYSFSVNTTKYGRSIKVQLRAYDKAGNVTTSATRTWHRQDRSPRNLTKERMGGNHAVDVQSARRRS
jgi:hypothetical protein